MVQGVDYRDGGVPSDKHFAVFYQYKHTFDFGKLVIPAGLSDPTREFATVAE